MVAHGRWVEAVNIKGIWVVCTGLSCWPGWIVVWVETAAALLAGQGFDLAHGSNMLSAGAVAWQVELSCFKS